MQSLKVKFVLSQVSQGLKKNIDWIRQEEKRLQDYSRSDSNPHKTIHRGNLEALIDIEKKLLEGEIQATDLASRPDSTLEEAMKILVGLRNEFEEDKAYTEQVFQLDKNNDLILGRSEMYPKILQVVDQMIQELQAEMPT